MSNNFLEKNFIYLLCLYIYVPEFPRIGILNYSLITFEKVEKNMEESFQSDVMTNWLFVV